MTLNQTFELSQPESLRDNDITYWTIFWTESSKNQQCPRPRSLETLRIIPSSPEESAIWSQIQVQRYECSTLFSISGSFRDYQRLDPNLGRGWDSVFHGRTASYGRGWGAAVVFDVGISTRFFVEKAFASFLYHQLWRPHSAMVETLVVEVKACSLYSRICRAGEYKWAMDDCGHNGQALLTNSVDAIRGWSRSGCHVVCLVLISRYRMTSILSSCGCFRLTCPLLREESACRTNRVISQDQTGVISCRIWHT